MLLWGCWLSWQGRAISDTYSESKQLLFVIYGISAQATVVILISYLVSGIGRATLLMVQAIVVLWSVVAALAAIFWPKYKLRHLSQFDIVQSATAVTSAGGSTKVQASATAKTIASEGDDHVNGHVPAPTPWKNHNKVAPARVALPARNNRSDSSGSDTGADTTVQGQVM